MNATESGAIVYLDASALVKSFVVEAGSAEVGLLIREARIVGTSLISRAEVVAAFARVVRMKLLSRQEMIGVLQTFRMAWPRLLRLELTETVIARADTLAWEHELRGYDAVHLAAALSWNEAIGEPVTLATFDRELWQAGWAAGLVVWPGSI